MRKYVLFIVFLTVCGDSFAQVQPFSDWVPNSIVHDIEQKGDTCYIGGSFVSLSRRTGGGFLLDPETLEVVEGFPAVNGTINCAVLDGKGGLYIGGNFTMVGGIPRQNFAHLNNQLSVTGLKVSTNEDIHAIAILNDHVYIGGKFSEVNGETKKYLIEIDPTTGHLIDLNFKVIGAVYTLCVYENLLFIGGRFDYVWKDADNIFSRVYKGRAACYNINRREITDWSVSLSTGSYDYDPTVGRIAANRYGVFLGGRFDYIDGFRTDGFAQVDLVSGKLINRHYNKANSAFFIKDSLLYTKNKVINIATSEVLSKYDCYDSKITEFIFDKVLFGDKTLKTCNNETHEVLKEITLESNYTGRSKRTVENNLGIVRVILPFQDKIFVGGAIRGAYLSENSNFGALDTQVDSVVSVRTKIIDQSQSGGIVHTIERVGNNAYVSGKFDRVYNKLTDTYDYHNEIVKIDLLTDNKLDWSPRIGRTIVSTSHDSVAFTPHIPFVFPTEDQILIVGNYETLYVPSEDSTSYIHIPTNGISIHDTEKGDMLYTYYDHSLLGSDVTDMIVKGDTAILSFQNLNNSSKVGIALLDIEEYSMIKKLPKLDKLGRSVSSLLLKGNYLYFIAGSSIFNLYKLNLADFSTKKLPITFDGPVNEMVFMGNHIVYVAGNFNNVNGFPRKQLAAIDLRTYEVKPWNLNIPPQPLDIQRMKAWGDQLAITGSFEYLGSTYAPNLALLDTAAGTYAQLSGRAYWDMNQNHQFDSGDQPMAGYAVDVQPGNYYATTDSLGFYRLAVDSGAYTLNLIVPEKRGFAVQRQHPPAEAGYSFSTDTLTEQGTQLDFAYFGEPRPYLSVDLDAGRRRRCFTSVTTVSYRNEGLLPASSARVQIQYPEHVVALSSTPAWDERNGNVLTYYVGDLSPDQSGRIVIRDSVVCGDESIRGLTQCTEAHIFPTNNRPVDPRWDQSETTVDAYCQDNGFVRIRLKNTGPEAMADSAAFRIYLDGELAHRSNYQLSVGDSLTLNVPSLGKTLRTEADLTAFHPDKTMNTVTVEGCGGSEVATISTGLVNSYSQNDEEDAFELSCSPIVDSYDPNDKQVVPTGIREEHFTQEESELEYTIRFQNTGTDTAYTVVIIDTLSEHLDLSTLRLGVTSHPVAWTLSGRGVPVLTWRFNQIDLPDSNRNEPASHGFVKFKVSMKEALPRGTVVANQAAIYFDYNSPIITNTAFNTVGLPEDTMARTEVQDCSQRPLRTGHRIDTVYLCGEHQLLLDAEDFGGGFGQWQLLEGQGSFEDPFAAQTSLNNVALGVNRVIWQVVYCDQSASHELIVIRSEARLDPPQVASNFYSYCAGEVADTLFAHGRMIRWYGDSTLTHLLNSGNSFRPEPSGSDTLYVTQTDGHCQSAAQKILVVAMPPPPPPAVIAYEHCDNIATTELSAEGQNLVWYADSLGSQVIGTGNTLVLPSEEILTNFYVSQTVNDCESGLSTLPIEIINFSTHDVFIPNVITPNSDQKNDYFFVPSSPLRHCLGDFQEVRIQNRWGKTVYHSQDENFQWHPSRKVSAGVYFYGIRFSNVKLNGSVSILR